MGTPVTCVFVGIDVGTSGVRTLAAAADGTIVCQAERPLASRRDPAASIHEQDPAEWWAAVCQTTQELHHALAAVGSPYEVAGISVTSTSGSLVAADARGRPLRAAILYDDGRAAEVADVLNRKVQAGGMRLNASYSLAKAAWMRHEEGHVWDHVAFLLHPADWLAGKLTGRFGVSDFSNALKLGYLPEHRIWDEAVSRAAIPSRLLPSVVAPGEVIGALSGAAAAETGLPRGAPVVAGATDGIACLIASGASAPPDVNTTLGTTIVWKALSGERPPSRHGIYCHLHPSGCWAPGAASNSGPGCLRSYDPSVGVAEMCQLAGPHLPTPVLGYLLNAKGERFPFVEPNAEGFLEGKFQSQEEWYAAQLQAIAFVERWGYEFLAGCGVPIGDVVYTAGRAAESAVLSQLRASVLRRTVARPRHPTGAFGAAILAATGTIYGGDVTAAIRQMTKVVETYAPSPELCGRYDDLYHSFREACRSRGYDT